MKPGDDITEEPPIGAVVRDRDDTQWEHTAGTPGWQTTGDELSWAGLLRYRPLILVSLPEPGEKWAVAVPLDVQVGDYLETCSIRRGVVEECEESAEPGYPDHRRFKVRDAHGTFHGYLDAPGLTLRRRTVAPMPEPGPSAVVDVATVDGVRRFHNLGVDPTSTWDGHRWATARDSDTYSWPQILELGPVTEVLAPLASNGGDR